MGVVGDQAGVGVRHSAARTIGLILGVVFLGAAYSKSIDAREAHAAVGHVWSVSPGVVGGLVRTLVVFEILLGAMLLSGLQLRVALGTAVAVLVGFSIWLIWLEASGAPVACGCGWLGGRFSEEWERPVALGRNAICLALGVAALRLTRTRPDGRLL